MAVDSESGAGLSLASEDHVVFTDLDGEGVLVDLKRRQFYQLNETATLIWRSLAMGVPVAVIVRQMTEMYDVSMEHAQSSVNTAVGAFIAHRWLHENRPNA